MINPLGHALNLMVHSKCGDRKPLNWRCPGTINGASLTVPMSIINVHKYMIRGLLSHASSKGRGGRGRGHHRQKSYASLLTSGSGIEPRTNETSRKELAAGAERNPARSAAVTPLSVSEKCCRRQAERTTRSVRNEHDWSFCASTQDREVWYSCNEAKAGSVTWLSNGAELLPSA